jgi:Lipocalin-like domain
MKEERQNDAGPLLGTWKLLSFTTEDLATGEKTELFGAHPGGYLSYGPNSRMYAILTRENRKPPNDFPPTDAERIDLYNGFCAYAGTYSVVDDKVNHHVEASWNQSWTGTIQVRRFRIDNERLILQTEPAENPLTGRRCTSVLVWAKLEQDWSP